jgi:hypothetical protein
MEPTMAGVTKACSCRRSNANHSIGGPEHHISEQIPIGKSCNSVILVKFLFSSNNENNKKRTTEPVLDLTNTFIPGNGLDSCTMRFKVFHWLISTKTITAPQL